jgi:hypothetical protein
VKCSSPVLYWIKKRGGDRKSWVVTFKKRATTSSVRIPQHTAHEIGASSFKLSSLLLSLSSSSSNFFLLLLLPPPPPLVLESDSGLDRLNYALPFAPINCVSNTVWGFLTQNLCKGMSSSAPTPKPKHQNTFIWRLVQNLYNTSGTTSSYTVAGTDFEFIYTHEHSHLTELCLQKGGHTIHTACFRFTLTVFMGVKETQEKLPIAAVLW